MRAAYRQFDAGPVVNLARHPRGTAYLGPGNPFPKWENSRWGNDGVYSLLTGITGHPDGITTAVRLTITNTPRNSHGFHIAANVEAGQGTEVDRMLPVRPGERITLTCWLRYTGPTVQAYTVRARFHTTDGLAWLFSGAVISQNFSLPSGAWVRLNYTYTVPVGAGYAAMMVTNGSNQVDAIGDTIDGTGLMVTRTPPPRANIASDPYATRVTVTPGTWGWNAQWFGQSGAGTTTPIGDATDGPDGITSYIRKQWTTIGTNLSNVAFNHTNSAAASMPRVTTGEQITATSYFRASKGWTVTGGMNCRYAFEWWDGAVKIGTTITGPQLSEVVAGTWHKLSFTATAPAGAVAAFVYQDLWLPMATWALGDTLDGTGLMVTRNPPLWRFADGNSPGWRWLGAVNTSESAGYPKP